MVPCNEQSVAQADETNEADTKLKIAWQFIILPVFSQLLALRLILGEVKIRPAARATPWHPVAVWKRSSPRRSSSMPFPYIDEMAGNGRRCRHRGRDEMVQQVDPL